MMLQRQSLFYRNTSYLIVLMLNFFLLRSNPLPVLCTFPQSLVLNIEWFLVKYPHRTGEEMFAPQSPFVLDRDLSIRQSLDYKLYATSAGPYELRHCPGMVNHLE